MPSQGKVANKCTAEDPSRRYRNLDQLRADLAGNRRNTFYICVIAFLLVMIGLLLWLNSPYRPTPTAIKDKAQARYEAPAPACSGPLASATPSMP